MRGQIREGDFVWLLGSLCRLHQRPFDATLLLDQYPPPHDLAALAGALDTLGLAAESTSLDAGRLRHLAPPFVAFLRAGADPVAAGVAGAGDQCGAAVPADNTPPAAEMALCPAVLIVGADAERVLCFRPGSDDPLTFDTSDFLARVEPTALAVGRKASAKGELADPGDEGLLRPTFGFRWFVPELLKHRRIWRDVLLASLAIQLLGLGLPVFTQVVIDKVVVHQTLSTLQVIGVGMAVFVLFSTGMSWLRQYLLIHTGNRVDEVLGRAVFRHLLRLPYAYFQRRPTGTLVARLQGIETIRQFLTGAAVSLLLDIPFMLLFLAVMFIYSWQLTLIALALLVLLVLLSLAITPVFRERLDRQFLLGARNQALLTEHVAGVETVKALQMEPQLERRYGHYLGDYLQASFATRQLSNTYNVVANGLEQAQTLGILIMGALLVIRGDGFTVGMLVAFQMFAGRLSQPVLRIVGLYQEFQQAAVAVRRLGDLMDCPAEPYGVAPSRPLGGPGRIEVRGLGFPYSEAHPWLYRNLDLIIPPGRTVALMGPSGCGKSTLAKLLQGFYLPREGAIRLDGIDTRHLSANELRQYFGVVPQETVLFSGTVYDNLIAANPRAGFEDVVTACKMAEIHAVIEQLPQGYQTEIGERGAGLSGGQKQRLAIARALLKKPRILIFDEATSGLDMQTAEHFAGTVNRLKGQVTMLFIAHQFPRGLEVDGVVQLGGAPAEQVRSAARQGEA